MNNKSKIIKVAVADDHVLVRDGLVKIIKDFGDCEVIFEASNGLEVKDKIKQKLIPDILALDLNMPEMNGIETAFWLRANHPEIRILIVSVYDYEVLRIKMLKAGVRGFFKKDIPSQELHFAILTVMKSGYYLSSEFTDKLLNKSFNNEEISEPDGDQLTDEEIEFIKLSCSDLTYKEICMQMELPPRRADRFRIDLFKKLHVQSRVGVALYAIKNGLVMIQH